MASRLSPSRPLTSLLTEVVSELAFLVQTEVRLARAELGERMSSAAGGIAMIGAAAVLLLPGVFILLLDAAQWLEVAGLPLQWGYLIVGIVVAAIGVALALWGARNLKIVPQRTIDQVRADISMAKEHAP